MESYPKTQHLFQLSNTQLKEIKNIIYDLTIVKTGLESLFDIMNDLIKMSNKWQIDINNEQINNLEEIIENVNDIVDDNTKYIKAIFDNNDSFTHYLENISDITNEIQILNSKIIQQVKTVSDIRS